MQEIDGETAEQTLEWIQVCEHKRVAGYFLGGSYYWYVSYPWGEQRRGWVDGWMGGWMQNQIHFECHGRNIKRAWSHQDKAAIPVALLLCCNKTPPGPPMQMLISFLWKHSSDFWIRSKPSSQEAAERSEAFSFSTDFFFFFFFPPSEKWLTSSHQALCLRRAAARCWQSAQVFEGSEFPRSHQISPLHCAQVPSICSPAKDGFLTLHSRCTVGCVHKCKYTQTRCALAPGRRGRAHTHTHTHTVNRQAGKGARTVSRTVRSNSLLWYTPPSEVHYTETALYLHTMSSEHKERRCLCNMKRWFNSIRATFTFSQRKVLHQNRHLHTHTGSAV